MLVRQLIDISGTIDGQDWPGKGNEIDVPDNVAADLIANRFAEPCGKAPKIETAAADPVTETATAAKPRARRTPKA